MLQLSIAWIGPFLVTPHEWDRMIRENALDAMSFHICEGTMSHCRWQNKWNHDNNSIFVPNSIDWVIYTILALKIELNNVYVIDMRFFFSKKEPH